MEGQRDYLQKKKEREEAGQAASIEAEEVKMKEKVAKLIKMRRLAKMAKVLDSSTVRIQSSPTMEIIFRDLGYCN